MAIIFDPSGDSSPAYDKSFGDPFVAASSSGYFAFGTGEAGPGGLTGGLAFEVLTSMDLRSWRSVGGALNPVNEEIGTHYWAPKVVCRQGTWFMFYSVGFGAERHHIRVATARRVSGPYSDCGVDLTPDELFAIDPYPFQDTDGAWYLFFARDDLTGEKVGTKLAVARLENMTRLVGEPRIILRPTDDWQLFEKQRTMYSGCYDWYTLEGPFVERRQDKYYCYFTGGSWRSDDSGIALATSDSILGPWRFSGDEQVVRTVPGLIHAPAHNCIAKAPDGREAIIFHAWNGDRTERRMFVVPMSP